MKPFLVTWMLSCLASVASAASAGVSSVSVGADGSGTETRVPAYAYESGPSRDQIIEELQRRYNARVVRVDELNVDGRAVYEVRLLSNDKVWTVRVDAASGRELPRN